MSDRLKALLEREDRIFFLTLAGLFVAFVGGIAFIYTAPDWETKFEVFKQTMINISLPILIPFVTKKTVEGFAHNWPQPRPRPQEKEQ